MRLHPEAVNYHPIEQQFVNKTAVPLAMIDELCVPT